MTQTKDGAPAAESAGQTAAPAVGAPAGTDSQPNGKPPRAPSPRRFARLAAIFFFDGFRAAPGWMTLVTAMLVLGSVASTCYPLGYKLIADGALAGSAGQVAGGVAVVAVLLSLAWVLQGIGATEAIALGDRIAVYRTGKLIELISAVPGLEHLERPDYLAQVRQLNAGRRTLAQAPRQIMSNVSSAARIIALLVLLGSVSPWLLLLPVTAVPPLLADRLAKTITKRSQDAMADDRRLAGMICDLGASASASAAGELRCYGLAPHLAAEQALFESYAEAAAACATETGTITLLVSHRFATVRLADQIIYLEEGHAAESGTHEELITRAGRYADLFTLQASSYR